MKSLRRFEGYYLIDHTESPGTERVPEGTKLELNCYRCAHCHRIVRINRKRVRPRQYCRKCDQTVCDHCPAPEIFGCSNLDNRIEQMHAEAVKQEALSKLRIL